MERPRHQVRGLRQGGRQLGVGVCLLGLLVVAVPTRCHAAEPAAPAKPGAQSAPQANQERFLQNFISQSLGQGQPATAVPATPAVPLAPPAAPGPQPTVPAQLAAQPGGDLTGAALKMVLSLGGILGLLILSGYVIRRYLLDQTFLGKRTPLMRVLARVNITPKAGVALLEVPGKVLVIGITGSTLVALGEVAAGSTLPLEQPTEALTPSFATTLENATRDHTTRDHSTSSLTDEERPADVLLKISEAIQQKVSRLKQI